MSTSTLEEKGNGGINAELIEVDGVRASALARQERYGSLTPEAISIKAGLGRTYGPGYAFQNHNHCQYARCVTRARK